MCGMGEYTPLELVTWSQVASWRGDNLAKKPCVNSESEQRDVRVCDMTVNGKNTAHTTATVKLIIDTK